jgi:uncharacterized RDD family membrane protein YckC
MGMKSHYNWFPAMSGDGQFAQPGASPFNAPMQSTALPGNIFAGQLPKSEGSELVTPESMPNREILASTSQYGPQVQHLQSEQNEKSVQPQKASAVEYEQMGQMASTGMTSSFTLSGSCSPWRRLVASVIDGILMSLLAIVPIVGLLMALTMGSAGLFDLQLLTDPIVGIALQVALSGFLMLTYIACEVFFLARFQASPGKLVMKLKVVGEASQFMSVKDATVRTVVKHVSFLVSGIVPIIGPLALAVLSLLHYQKGGRMVWDAVVRKQVYFGL